MVSFLEKNLIRITVFTFFCALFLIFYKPIEIEDIWWHLSTGKWIIENLSVPDVDLFPYNQNVTAGISPQWLGSCIYYLVYHTGGFVGLKLFRAIFFLLVIGTYMRYGYKRIPVELLLFLVFLAVYSLQVRSFMRPFVFNFIFIQILLTCLFDYQNSLRKSRLFILLMVGILWSNIHIGGFIYGIGLLAIFIFSTTVQYVQTALKDEKKRRYFCQIRELTLTLLAYVCVLIVNPYGLEGFLYPFKVFLVPNFINFDKLSNVIAELLPPTYIFSLSGYWFYLLCLLSGLAIHFARRDKLNLTLLFLFALFLFFRHQRAVVFFSIISLYIIAKSAGENSFIDIWKGFKYRRWINVSLCLILICFSAVHIVERMHRKAFFDGRSQAYLATDVDPRNPKALIQFLKEHNLTGPIFNSSGMGGVFNLE